MLGLRETLCETQYIFLTGPPDLLPLLHAGFEVARRFLESAKRQQTNCLPVIGPGMHEVIGSNMILMSWPAPYTRTVVQPDAATFGLPAWYLQARLTPKSLHSLVIHLPAFPSQERRDSCTHDCV